MGCKISISSIIKSESRITLTNTKPIINQLRLIHIDCPHFWSFTCRLQYFSLTCLNHIWSEALQVGLLSDQWHQFSKLSCFSSGLVVVFAQSIEVRCSVENEDVVGASWTGSNYIWVINNYIVYQGAPYIRGLTVVDLSMGQAMVYNINSSYYWG